MSSLPNDTLVQINTSRGEMYTFLAKIFCTVPDSELFEVITSMNAKLQAIKETTDNEHMLEGISGIDEFVNHINGLDGDELSKFDLKIKQNYTTLYCLAKSVPTDESIYTCPEHHERQDSWDAMKLLFKRFDMKKSDTLSENEDFISYELYFMAKLSFAMAEFAAEGKQEHYDAYRDEQQKFHVNHFDKWIAEFVKRTELAGVKDEILYRYIAKLMLGFIEEDKLLLEDI